MRSNRKNWRRHRYTVHVWSLISVYGIYGRGRITTTGRFPYSFREACEFPCIGLVKVERLGQRLNVPTQGRRVAQKGTKPFSLTAPGSDLQQGIEPGPHWWETDMLTTRPPEQLWREIGDCSQSGYDTKHKESNEQLLTYWGWKWTKFAWTKGRLRPIKDWRLADLFPLWIGEHQITTPRPAKYTTKTKPKT